MNDDEGGERGAPVNEWGENAEATENEWGGDAKAPEIEWGGDAKAPEVEWGGNDEAHRLVSRDDKARGALKQPSARRLVERGRRLREHGQHRLQPRRAGGHLRRTAVGHMQQCHERLVGGRECRVAQASQHAGERL